MILNYKRVIYLIENNIPLPKSYKEEDYNEYMIYANMLYVAERSNSNMYKNLIDHKKSWIEGFNRQQEEEQKGEVEVDVEGGVEGGGSKSQRRHRRHRKLVRKTRRGRKSKSKTHRRRSARKNKKYTRKR